MHPEPITKLLGFEVSPVEVMDVGAMSEGADRYGVLVEKGLAAVTGFEPDPQQYEALCAAKMGPYRYFPYFLGNGEPARFHRTHYPGCSSLYEPDPSVIDLFTSIGASVGGNFSVVDTIAVQTRRLDDVPDCPLPDYLKLDVQGAELVVLQYATKALTQACVIELEAEFVPLYKGQPLFGDVQVFLRQHGLLLHKLIDVAGRPFRPWVLNGQPFQAMSQLLWADAVFVRDFSVLERWTSTQLLKAVVVLHEVYRSYDLAHYLFVEHDRRHSTTLAEKYTRHLQSFGDLPVLYLNQKVQP